MYEGAPLGPGQYGPQRHQYERPESVKFSHNPLPTPPKDIFEASPYIGLLKDLHRPVEETTLRRTTTSPQYATAYIVSPTGSQASREKKPRKGLFRSLSNRLAGKPRREPEPQAAYQVPIILASAPVMPGVVPGNIYSPAVPPPGMVWSSGGPQGQVPGETMRSNTPQPQAPPSPAPSHRSHRSHRSRHSPRRSPRPLPLKIDLHNQFAGLTHLSSHRVHHDRKLYPSAFHLLEALRFIDTRPDLSEQIRRCPSADEVKAIVSQNSAFCRPDWENVVLHMMDEVLYTKFIQHPHLRSLLLSTGAAELLYADTHDNMWGDGPLGRGANELGRSLERVRDRLISEGFSVEET
ncbi:hypothetical protein BC835DRAFT_1362774 [Cytidiella melzeri]|nr:hypothetical protein BC835DRAFT_1362774 [Cytidiella melzeri]